MRVSTALALVALACAQGACSKGAPANNVTAVTTAGGNGQAQPVAGGGAPPPATPARLSLRSGGLDVNGARIGFGSARDLTMQRLQMALGGPASRTPRTDDCGTGMRESVDWPNGLTTYFTSTNFVGWSASTQTQGPTPLRTAQNIGPGSTRAEVERANLPIGDTVHGYGFAQGDMVGTLDSDQPTAVVTEIWAGRTCAGAGGS